MQSFEKPPWHKPGYTGKLRPMPLIPGRPGYQPKTITSEQYVEFFYELFADGMLNEDQLNTYVAKVAAGTWNPVHYPIIEDFVQTRAVQKELNELLNES